MSAREAPGDVSAGAVAGALSRVLRAHGGGLELAAHEGTAVRVRFTGMCAVCACRPLCHENLVRPALLAVDGVETVEAPGTRTDASVSARIAALHGRQEAQDDHDDGAA